MDLVSMNKILIKIQWINLHKIEDNCIDINDSMNVMMYDSNNIIKRKYEYINK